MIEQKKQVNFLPNQIGASLIVVCVCIQDRPSISDRKFQPICHHLENHNGSDV